MVYYAQMGLVNSSYVYTRLCAIASPGYFKFTNSFRPIGIFQYEVKQNKNET